MKIRYILSISSLNSRRKRRADIYVSLKYYVGNDERESGICKRPGDRLAGVFVLHCEPVRHSGDDYCKCSGFGCLRDGWERITRA